MSVEDLRRLAYETEHKTVAVFTPDGRSSCGVTTPVHVLEDALKEISLLREAIRRLADQDVTLSVQGGNVTVTMDATLTDEEREAVEWAAMFVDENCAMGAGDTLRNLLERLK